MRPDLVTALVWVSITLCASLLLVAILFIDNIKLKKPDDKSYP